MLDKKDIITNADNIREAINHAILKCDDYNNFEPRSTDSKNNIVGKSIIMRENILKDIKILDYNSKKRYFESNLKVKLWENSLKTSTSTKGSKVNITCAICNQKILKFTDCEVDHIIPYSKGGTTTVENAQLVHSTCNKMKGNSTTQTKLSYQRIQGSLV